MNYCLLEYWHCPLLWLASFVKAAGQVTHARFQGPYGTNCNGQFFVESIMLAKGTKQSRYIFSAADVGTLKSENPPRIVKSFSTRGTFKSENLPRMVKLFSLKLLRSIPPRDVNAP